MSFLDIAGARCDRVPILTQSENWALFEGAVPILIVGVVPILTQSENWALFARRLDKRASQCECSNPHPVRKLGAMQLAALPCVQLFVPILTQSENWALSAIAKGGE